MNASRSEQRPRRPHRSREFLGSFSAYIATVIDRHGGVDFFADLLGFTAKRVQAWVDGDAIPYVRVLVRIAEVFDEDLAELLDAAGRPPVAGILEAVAANPSATLGMILSEFRDSNGFDTQEAADALGVSRFDFSKHANGSKQVQTLAAAFRLGNPLGLSVAEVLDASAVSADSELRAKLASRASGFPAVVHDAIADAGFNPWSRSDVSRAAKLASITPDRMFALLAAKTTPTAADCQKVAKLSGDDLVSVMVAAGFDAPLASRFALALPEAAKIRTYDSLGEIVKAYRIVTGISMETAAERAGYRTHTSVFRIEHNESVPTLGYLVALADVIGAPLPLMIAAAGVAV